MNYKIELDDITGYKKLKLDEGFEMIENVFEDMESFGEAIFEDFLEKVVKGESEYEEIGGNMCNLEIRRDYTVVSCDFGDTPECKVDTEELLKLIGIWKEINEI